MIFTLDNFVLLLLLYISIIYSALRINWVFILRAYFNVEPQDGAVVFVYFHQIVLVLVIIMDTTTARFLSIVSNSCDARELVEWFDSLPQTKPKLVVLRDQIKFLNERYSSGIKETPLNLALWSRRVKGSDHDNSAIVSTSSFFRNYYIIIFQTDQLFWMEPKWSIDRVEQLKRSSSPGSIFPIIIYNYQPFLFWTDWAPSRERLPFR